MGTSKTMRIGVNPFYPVPPEVEASDRVIWLIERSVELGCTALQPGRVGDDPDQLKRIREVAEASDVELEVGAPGVFGLVGSDATASREQLLKGIGIAQQLGCKIIRTGYGRLNVPTSRFNKEIPISEHLDLMLRNLEEAALIVEDHGLLLAIENHCDFTGKQWVQVFEALDSPSVGVALDTANGFTVFCDPNDDVQDLARFTVTTHLKDMKIVDDFRAPSLIPLIPVGCALGEGNVDIAEAVKTLAEQSPHAEGLHLIIELGWERIPEGKTREEVRYHQFHQSIRYLKELLS